MKKTKTKKKNNTERAGKKEKPSPIKKPNLSYFEEVIHELAEKTRANHPEHAIVKSMSMAYSNAEDDDQMCDLIPRIGDTFVVDEHRYSLQHDGLFTKNTIDKFGERNSDVVIISKDEYSEYRAKALESAKNMQATLANPLGKMTFFLNDVKYANEYELYTRNDFIITREEYEKAFSDYNLSKETPKEIVVENTKPEPPLITIVPDAPANSQESANAITIRATSTSFYMRIWNLITNPFTYLFKGIIRY